MILKLDEKDRNVLLTNEGINHIESLSLMQVF